MLDCERLVKFVDAVWRHDGHIVDADISVVAVNDEGFAERQRVAVVTERTDDVGALAVQVAKFQQTALKRPRQLQACQVTMTARGKRISTAQLPKTIQLTVIRRFHIARGHHQT